MSRGPGPSWTRPTSTGRRAVVARSRRGRGRDLTLSLSLARARSRSAPSCPGPTPPVRDPDSDTAGWAGAAGRTAGRLRAATLQGKGDRAAGMSRPALRVPSARTRSPLRRARAGRLHLLLQGPPAGFRARARRAGGGSERGSAVVRRLPRVVPRLLPQGPRPGRRGTGWGGAGRGGRRTGARPSWRWMGVAGLRSGGAGDEGRVGRPKPARA